MDINTFTQRSQQAIIGARDAAGARSHQYVQPEHLLDALLAQTDGLVYPIMASVGAHVTDIRGPLEADLAAIPTVIGGTEVAFSADTLAVLEQAGTEREAMGDAYTSVEHIMMALAESPGDVGQILHKAGITRDSVITICKHWGMKVTERMISIHEVLELASSGELKEMFGSGTAAVISWISRIADSDREWTFDFDERWQQLYDALVGIQTGIGDDPYGWRHEIPLT